MSYSPLVASQAHSDILAKLAPMTTTEAARVRVSHRAQQLRAQRNEKILGLIESDLNATSSLQDKKIEEYKKEISESANKEKITKLQSLYDNSKASFKAGKYDEYATTLTEAQKMFEGSEGEKLLILRAKQVVVELRENPHGAKAKGYVNDDQLKKFQAQMKDALGSESDPAKADPAKRMNAYKEGVKADADRLEKWFGNTWKPQAEKVIEDAAAAVVAPPGGGAVTEDERRKQAEQAKKDEEAKKAAEAEKNKGQMTQIGTLDIKFTTRYDKPNWMGGKGVGVHITDIAESSPLFKTPKTSNGRPIKSSDQIYLYSVEIDGQVTPVTGSKALINLITANPGKVAKFNFRNGTIMRDGHDAEEGFVENIQIKSTPGRVYEHETDEVKTWGGKRKRTTMDIQTATGVTQKKLWAEDSGGVGEL